VFVDKLFGLLPFLALGGLGVANLFAAVGAMRAARGAEELGEGRFELLRDQQDRLELLREERKMVLDELERERQERLAAQATAKRLMQEHPHLELEREVLRLTEELELEREGRAHNHHERQRLSEELERERLARLESQRDVLRVERDLKELQQLLEEQSRKKGLWTNLLRSNKR
jgi:hypothetical protein